MQFLGPFLASFYPFVYSVLKTILPGTSEFDGSNHSGIVAQFFPHASSMVRYVDDFDKIDKYLLYTLVLLQLDLIRGTHA